VTVFRRALVFAAFLGLGAMAGLVLAGRLAVTSTTEATPPPAQIPGAILPSAATPLPDLSSVAERAVLASANISSTQKIRVRPNPLDELFFGRREMVQESQSLGSGVIVSADGYVLTNNHVIGDDRGLRVEGIDIKVTLPDGRELPGQIVGTDQATDLALVKVQATRL
jgi:serine protease Do